jgi:hypothetical protein
MRPKIVSAVAVVFLASSIVVFALANSQGGDASIELQRIDDDESPPGHQLRLATPGPGDAEKRAEITSLISRWTQPLIYNPGWLHVKEQVDQDDLELGNLPNRQPIPQDYFSESWYLLDSSGVVEAAVSIISDLEGREVQKSLFEEGAWRNLTFDFKSPEESFTPQLDHGVSRDIASVGSFGITSFDSKETTASGRSQLEVTTLEEFEPSTKFEGFPSAVSTVLKRAIFDRSTGELLTYETVLRTIDGRDVVVSRVTLMVVEKLEAVPDQVISLFAEEPK